MNEQGQEKDRDLISSEDVLAVVNGDQKALVEQLEKARALAEEQLRNSQTASLTIDEQKRIADNLRKKEEELALAKQKEQEDAELAVAITDKRNQNYLWLTSNPRAYKNWFESINRPFLEYDRQNKRRVLFEKSRTVYNSIEEIPEDLERSSLQRIIQILKHHRDVYYCRIRKEDLKPTSAIITTICAEIAYGMDPSLNVFELLQAIVNDFEIYSRNQTLTEEEFSRQYETKNTIRKSNGKWCIMNPVNPKDNLADSWNDNPEKAELFFKWVKVMKKDCLDSLQIEDNDFVALLENNFGRDYVKKSINLNDYANVTPTIITNTPKPWRK